MGNKCSSSSKQGLPKGISSLRTYVIPKKTLLNTPEMSHPNSKADPTPLKFNIDIDKIKCKNLTQVILYL